jgi:hypothetical protein
LHLAGQLMPPPRTRPLPLTATVTVMPALYSVTTLAVVIFPIRSPSDSVNQRLPSGPAAIP